MTAEPARRCDPQPARSNLKVLLCAAVVVSGIGAAAPLPAAAQTIEPRWKLEAGTELVYRQSVQSETELPQGMGTSTMNMQSTQRWSVLDVDGDGNAAVRLTTEGARMRVGGPLETMSIGPVENESAGSPLDAMQALDGTSYTVVLDARGALVSMSGLEEMRDALRARIPDPSGHAMLDQMLSEDTLRRHWAQGVHVLPAEAVGVGSAWDGTLAMPLPLLGTMTFVTSYRVESIDGGLVVIGSSGTVSLADDTPAAAPLPVNFGDMTTVGTSRFDAGRGLLLGSDSTSTFRMSMAMGGQETVLDSVMTVSLELVEGP